MKLNYFPDTDSLYIDLSHKPSTESQEVSEGVVLDYDAEGNLVGIDNRHLAGHCATRMRRIRLSAGLGLGNS